MFRINNSAKTIDSNQLSYRSEKIRRPLLRKIKRPKIILPTDTSVKRSQQNEEFTILRIRFASVQRTESKTEEDQRAFIKSQSKAQQQIPSPVKLPFIKYKKTIAPQDQLKNLGYSPDTRLASQAYEDKVEQKKKNFLNRMETFKIQLKNQATSPTKKYNQLEKNKIKSKILVQEIRRKRERESLQLENRKQKNLFHNLLGQSASDAVLSENFF